jgi:hypothetical protein
MRVADMALPRTEEAPTIDADTRAAPTREQVEKALFHSRLAAGDTNLLSERDAEVIQHYEQNRRDYEDVEVP